MLQFLRLSVSFQLIVFGFVSSLLISVLKYAQMRVFGYLSTISILFILLTTNSIQKLAVKFIIRDLAFGISLVFCIYIAFRLYKSFTVLSRTGNELAHWAFTIVISHMVPGILLSLLFGSSHLSRFVLYQLQFSAIIGAGVSTGIIIGNKINRDLPA